MSKGLVRDKVFWTVAVQVAIVNFYLGGFGPAQPLLRADQGTSLTVAGLHGTAMGIAGIISGLTNARLVHIFGRRKLSWFALALFCLGALLFVIAPPVQLTLFATFITGLGISTVVNNMVTRLNEHHKASASLAIAQGAGVASFGYVIGTLVIGTLAGTSISWRLGLLLVIPVSLALYLKVRGETEEAPHLRHEDGPQSGKLPIIFWVAWIGFFTFIATEFATTFWSAALLKERVGSSAAISTLAVVALGGGMGIGRWFGGIVLKKLHLDSQLKTILLLQLVSFMTFWFSHNMLVSLVALFATGLGISMQFGLGSLRLIGFSNHRPDLAMGRSSLGAGSAIALSPLILGLLGDHIGISRAFLMVSALIVIGLSIIILLPSHENEINELQN
jgi:predicted MFS family arabinose efflux permease